MVLAATAWAGGGLVGLELPDVRPAGLPPHVASTTLEPDYPEYRFWDGAASMVGVAVAGPSAQVLDDLYLAENLLIQDCMQDRGADWTWDPQRINVENAETGPDEKLVRVRAQSERMASFGDPDVAAEQGYGIDWPAWQAGVLDAYPPRLDEPAKYGVQGSEDPERSRRLVEGDGTGQGCAERARTELYGDARQWERSTSRAGDVGDVFQLRAFATQHLVQLQAADVAWSSCMAQRGWRNLSEQLDAYSLAFEAWGAAEPDAADTERRIAVDDAHCVQQTGYDDVYADAEAAVVEHVQDDPDLAAYGALIERGLSRAADVLQEDRDSRLTPEQREAVERAEGELIAEADAMQQQSEYLQCMAEQGLVVASLDEDYQAEAPDLDEITPPDASAADVDDAHRSCLQP